MKIRETGTCLVASMLTIQMLIVMLSSPALGQATWTIQVVAGPGDVGYDGISLTFSPSGNPHIAYQNATGTSLDRVYWDGAQWQHEVIFPDREGYNPSLKLDPTGYGHVAFRDQTDLVYSNNTGGSWVRQVIDFSGNVGFFSSMVLRGGTLPSISYYDALNTALKYASFDGVTWSYLTVDNTGDVGRFSSIALDTSGFPHIAYYDASGLNLKHAWWDGSTWQIETVESTGSVGRYCSLAIDSSDKIHVSYANETGPSSLRYALKTGMTWTFQTVDFDPDVGLHTSIALNSTGVPAIAYYDGGNARLKFAMDRGGFWSKEVVDSQAPSGDVGQFASLALDPADHAGIAYWDEINNDVKYANSTLDYVDLAVAPSDILFTPSQPYDPGTVVTINATIHNIGSQDASDVTVRFYDGPPIPANQIDGDKVIPFLPGGGSFGVEVTWTAQPMGEHCINTVVDPDDSISELSEANNVAVNCVQVKGPDLVLAPSNVTWNPPGNVSLSSSVDILANVSNQGTGSASSVLVRFWDGAPGTVQIGGDQVLPLIASGGNGTATVSWVAQPAGSHQICVQVDPDDTITETNETNNDACIAVIVTLPDLEVHAGDLDVDPATSVFEGTPMTFNLTYRNIGGLPAGSVTVSLYDGRPGSGSEVLIGNRTSPPMSPGSSQLETWPWTANASRSHTFYGVLDGASSLSELNESNNLVNLTVIVMVHTDFVAENFTATPPGPVLLGTTIDLNATWGNLETTAGTAEFTIYEDLNGNNMLDMGEAIGSWRLTLASSENASRNSMWSSLIPGIHALCALADSFQEVAETQEGNNQMCITVEVLGKPDLEPANPLPSPPIIIGTGQVVQLSLQVINQGGSTAGASTLVFRNQTEPVPFQTFDVPSLDPGIPSQRYTAVWQAPIVTGLYIVEAVVDNGSVVDEADESDNVQLFQITVSDLPRTTLFVGTPNYTAAATFVTSSTQFTLVAEDFSGTGIKQILYKIDNGLLNQYTSPFILVGEGVHSIEYFSEDNAGNVELPKTANFTVDNSAPTSSHAFGSPSYLVGGIWIDRTTPLALSAADNPVLSSGVMRTRYRVYDGSNWGPWDDYLSELYFSNEAAYALEYSSEDNLGNAESTHSVSFKVDNSPPTVSSNIGTPRYRTSALDVWNMTSATAITATPFDPGATAVGVQLTQYSVDSGSLTNYTPPIYITQEGAHTISFVATDKLGHVSSYHNLSVVVDSTPPTIDIQVGMPKYVAASTWVTSASTITITGVDGGSPPVGLESVTYRVWEGSWKPWAQYLAPFPIGTPQGQRYIEATSADHLQNQGPTQNVSLLVDDNPPTGMIVVSEPKYVEATPTLFVSGATGFTLIGSDVAPTPSGLAGLRYSIDGSAFVNYAGVFNISASGEGGHTITYNATDNLGHYSTGSTDVSLDMSPPTTSFQISKKSGSGTFWLNATDARVGVNSTFYSVNYGAFQRYTGPVTLANGDYRIEYYSDDLVRNEETPKVGTFNITTDGGGGGGGGPAAEETNIAPAFAVVLGIVLMAMGVAVRRKSRGALAAGIVLGVVEMMMGMTSMFIQDLEIPPWIGLGLILLIMTVVVGIIAVAVLARRGASAQAKAKEVAKKAEALKREEMGRQERKKAPLTAEGEEAEEMEEVDEGELQEALESLEELEE